MRTVATQRVLNLNSRLVALKSVVRLALGSLRHGQPNFIRCVEFNSVYNPMLQIADHQQPVKYEITLPPGP